jgi:serine/threonine-protein kinase RsbW
MSRTLTVPGRYDRLEQVCQFVAEAAEQAGLDESESSHCQLAVDEACTNIIEHGYGGENVGEINLTCTPTPGELIITIQDTARPFDPAEVPDPDLSAPLDEMRIGGLGLFFMRQVMDAVEFTNVGGGNMLVLVKRKDNRKARA